MADDDQTCTVTMTLTGGNTVTGKGVAIDEGKELAKAARKVFAAGPDTYGSVTVGDTVVRWSAVTACEVKPTKPREGARGIVLS